MSQHDFVIDDQAGLSFLADLNSVLGAAASNSSGPLAPSTTYPNMWWADTAADLLKRRNSANTGWVDIEPLATGIKAISQGGTGAVTANAAADALGAYRKGTILGTVSQAAGVPTGSIIETATNANGTYIRWADGTQICTFINPTLALIAINEVYGSMFLSQIQQWTYPAVFTDIPVVVGSFVNGGGAVPLIGVEESYTSYSRYYLVNPVSETARSYKVSIFAIGRWF